MIEEDYYWYWINNIHGVSSSTVRMLLNSFDSPENVYKCNNEVLEKLAFLSDANINAIIESKTDDKNFADFLELDKLGIKFTYPGKDDYPKRLKHLYDYPLILYYKGKLPDDDIPTVGIVGARNCTDYGQTVAYSFASELGKMGIQVISGMALGIDGRAHRGCLDNNGYTAAILGCGVDICYPRTNIEIYSRLCSCGGVISEYAIGTPPRAGQFPVRNRIISGLSDAIIVVEARYESGSLITSDQALEQGKDVYAVPGRIGDKLSEGCIKIIKEGATVISKVEDLLDTQIISEYINKKKELSYLGGFSRDETFFQNINDESALAKEKYLLYSHINLCPTTINSIVENTGYSFSKVSRLLLDLELEGMIKEVSKNNYVRMHI